jgi:hypothetical protein
MVRNYLFVGMEHLCVGMEHLFVGMEHLFVGMEHLFVGTQDLCVQSNKNGSNKNGSNKNDSHPNGHTRLDTGLDWTQRSCVPTNNTFQNTRNFIK